MVKAIVILAMIGVVSCLSTFPYTFSAATNSIYQTPSYPLGYASLNAKV